MKVLDTPVLLDLLRGRPSAKKWLKELHGEEIATTELNLFELGRLSSRGGRRPDAALDRLRRSLTVLPIDERAVRGALDGAPPRNGEAPGAVLLMLGAADAAGAEEWLTHRSWAARGTRFRTKVRIIG